MAKYVIGVDGGNTKTHYALFDIGGNLVNFIQAGMASHECFTDGYEGAKLELEIRLNELTKGCGLYFKDIGFSVMGLAGADIPKQYSELSRRIQEIGLKNFKVYNDAYLGIKAGSSKGYGICSVCGTGPSCAAIDRNGRYLQNAGMSSAFGEASGAGYIGMMVVKKVYDSIFRCGRKTVMKDMLFRELDITDENVLVETVYDKVYTGRISMASFCRIMFYAANESDEVALDVLRQTGKDAAKSVVGAIRRLDFSKDEEIDVIMAGSVYVKGENPVLVDSFKKEICDMVERKVNFTVLQAPPVAGAVLWAMEELKGSLSQEIRHKVINRIQSIKRS